MHPELVHLRLFGVERVVHSYGVLLVAGVALGIAVTVARARRFGIERFDALAIGLFALAGGMLGSTLLYVVVHWRDMLHAPALLLSPGLVFYGGLVGGALGVFVYCRKFAIALLPAADCAAPGLAFGHALGRIGCFLGGCCYGKVAPPDFRFFVWIDGLPRYPVQLYEAAGLALLGCLTAAMRARPAGRVIASYVGGYAILRLFTETLRGDDAARGFVVPGLVSTSQAIALAMLLVAGALVYRLRRAQR